MTDEDSLANIFTAMYLLEGMLLYLVAKMDKRNVRAVAYAYKEIKVLMRSLETTAKTVKIILPR